MQNYFQQLGLKSPRKKTADFIQRLPDYLNDKGEPHAGSMRALLKKLKRDGLVISEPTLYTWLAVHRAARTVALGQASTLPVVPPSRISPPLWESLRTAKPHTITSPTPPPAPPGTELVSNHEAAAILAAVLHELPAVIHELRELVVLGREAKNGNGNGNGHHHEAGAVTVLEAPPASPPLELLKAGPLPSDWFAKPTEKRSIIEVMSLPVRTMGGWRMVYTPACCKDLEDLQTAFRPLVRDHLVYFVNNPRDSRLHRRASRDVHTHQLRKDHGVKGCDLETLRIGRYRMYLAVDDMNKIYHFTGLVSNTQRG